MTHQGRGEEFNRVPSQTSYGLNRSGEEMACFADDFSFSHSSCLPRSMCHNILYGSMYDTTSALVQFFQLIEEISLMSGSLC